MKNNFLSIGMLAVLSIGFQSCSNNTDEGADTNAPLYKEVLTNIAENVITETYGDFTAKAALMQSAANTLTIGNDASLTTLKTAWVNTRRPWEESEGFIFGPVDTNGIDPAVDSWPVNVNDINTLLNSGTAITASVLANNNEARGFHSIEYFIWGINGTKTAADFTAREIEYLKAASEDLYNKTITLHDAWKSNGGNFQRNLAIAGEQGSIYTSQKTALIELVDGIIGIADEVANGKIASPLTGNNGGALPEAEESRFSNNSKADFANNIRSIQNVYLGDFNGHDGKGLTDIVALKNANVDTTIKTKIADAITAIESINGTGTFTVAIVNNRDEVFAAQAKVSDLQIYLSQYLKPLISNL